MATPSSLIRVSDDAKSRLIAFRWDGESMDNTIQRMLNILEPKQRIKKKE